MDASEENDDLFADLYGEDEPSKDTTTTTQPSTAPAPAPVPQAQPTSAPESSYSAHAEPVQQAVDPRQPQAPVQSYQPHDEIKQEQHSWDAPAYGGDNDKQEDQGYHHQSHNGGNNGYSGDHGTGSPAIKEDGKMFIGGLNWETTDESLKDYFSQFGEVVECTVMRDGPTGRSRGFGFLTFKDPKTVNIVMVKEHFLDGKIIDPKRAIPRDEQEKTSKIFVGGVSQEATESDFREYFMQFGRVLDSTLMMDKDTGRPRGFGFVTFDSESAVENALSHPNLEILGKAIEVKKAQPRGKTLDNDRDGGFRDRGHHNRHDGGGHNNFQHQQGPQNQQQMPSGPYNGLSPQMMMQYFQNMQRYMSAMSQQMAAGRGNGQPMPTPAFNPAMMNPAMIQQMQIMQARMVQQQQQQAGMGGPGGMVAGPQGSVSPPQGFNSPAGLHGGYDQQQQQFGRGAGGFQGHPGPQRDFQQPGQQQGNWEGMYDDVPQQQGMHQQQQMGGHHGVGPIRTGTPNNRPGPAGPPPNAPTGPKSQRPAGNFRGAGRGVLPGRGGPVGRGYGGAGYHPYARNGGH